MDYTEPKRSVMSAKKFFAQLLTLARNNDNTTHLAHGRNIMLDTDVLQSFYLECRIKNLRPATLKCYADRLSFLAILAGNLHKPIIELDQSDIKRYILNIIDSVSPETVNGRIRVFRVFANYLKNEGMIPTNPMDGISLLRIDHQCKPTLTSEQLTLLLKSCNPRTFFGSRNRNIILTLTDAMIRVGELCNIVLDDISLNDGIIQIHRTKARRERTVPISFATAKSIHSYLVRLRRKLPGQHLFCYRDGQRMKEQQIARTFNRKANLLGFKVYAHLLRHTGATEYLRRGGNLAVLQRILGHSDIRMTQEYIHVNKRDFIDHDKFSPVAGLAI
jgi:integrase/recombinase XerD